MRPRVGHIQFLNCLPLYYGLVKNGILLDVELIKGTPTELNRFLLAGELDISPISSIEYCRHHRELLLFPSLTVACDGEVKSILLVSKVPAGELSGKKVALSNTSATSHVLLHILLVQRYGVTPRYFVSPPDLGAMLLEAEAALLIGDHALHAYYTRKNGLHLYDLGHEWKILTGHKMVYAVWAVRKEFARSSLPVAQAVYRAFLQSKEYSRQNLSSIAHDVARWGPFDAGFLEEYFSSIQFDFGKGYQEGLREFYRRAWSLGFVDDVAELEFVDV